MSLQVRSVLPSDTSISLRKLLHRLDALLMVTKSCKGDRCRRPWAAIHRDGTVRTLSVAMREEFDTFYESVGLRVAYDHCEAGYIKSAEGEQESIPYIG